VGDNPLLGEVSVVRVMILLQDVVVEVGEGCVMEDTAMIIWGEGNANIGFLTSRVWE
jgi:hypothetical protein